MTSGAASSPLVLALDTATDVASWALWREDALVAEASAVPDRPTAEVLLPTLDRLLEGSDIGLDDVDAFAVSIGPGSFTGLRVGVATIKGLAFEPARPTLAVPTLAALACHGGVGSVAAVLDARRGEVYAAGFEIAEGGAPVAAGWLREGVVAVRELGGRLPGGCRVVGDGLAVCAEALGGYDVVLAAPPYAATTARHVAALGARGLSAGDTISAGVLAPRYVRRAEAEVKRTGERFEAEPESA